MASNKLHQFGCSLFLLSLLGTASAQTGVGDPPLTIAGVRLADGDSSVASFEVTNRTDVPVAGYVLRCRTLDGSGKPAMTVTSIVAFNGVIPSMPRQNLAPGASFSDRIRLGSLATTNHAAGSPAVDLVYVLFADGTSWGNESGKAAATLRGMQRGAAMEREVLRQKLSQEGVAGLERTLKMDRQ